ncbi:glycosyltransferase [Fragilaria crotonensis]|nr:glycosyltransferase [Fragilaria crotonensis]
MRGKIVMVLIAGVVVLAASLLWLEFLASLHASNFYGSCLPLLSPNENSGVVNSSSTRSNIANPVGWTQGAQGRKKIALDELTDEKGQNVSCPPNTQPIFNNPIPSTNFSSNYKIPFVIHQTFKTRCVTDDFYQLTLAWKALGIPYYFHDDAAIERLVRLGYEEFPHLILTWEHCITKPVVKTDLWRLCCSMNTEESTQI